MYPFIRDIFVALGHPALAIQTDSRTSSGGRPDVKVDAVADGTTLVAWIVVEAKDEEGCFADDDKTKRILDGKWRYVTPDTEWFLAIDPLTIRIRHVSEVEDPKQPEPDVIVSTGALVEVKAKLAALHHDRLGDRRRLREFREGARRSFGRIDVETERGRALFQVALRQSADDLNRGVRAALADLHDGRLQIAGKLRALNAEFPGVKVLTSPFRTRGTGSVNTSDARRFRLLIREIRDLASRMPDAFSIELTLFPLYRARVAAEGKGGDEVANQLLADETAALLLSRVLLLRFFEDNEYFDAKRYLCNGGVAAFQQMRDHLGEKYPSLVRTAYEAGTGLYPSVFEFQPQDWILHSTNGPFSTALEHAMMLLAQYDFRTIREELLSGLYGKFFDEAQRKRRGEHYTPPTVARWMVKRAYRSGPVKLLDPACGFGTFLVAGWQELVGKRATRGAITEKDAEDALEGICGNDLNRFSAALTQMQILWTLIQSRPKGARRRPLPPLNVSSGFDSLAIQSLFSQAEEMEVTPWTDISGDEYPMVVGNPPWVRAERRDADLTREQAEYFAHVGEGNNYYGLFLYRAISEWAAQGGRVGFVIPLTFVDTKNAARLRALFQPGGRFAIIELVDFEVVKTAMFPSANVRPIIIFAERRPALATDEVKLRFVDHGQLKYDDGSDIPVFDIEAAPVTSTTAGALFDVDGRILLRLTAARLPLVQKLRALPTFRDIAHKAWDLRRGNTIVSRHLSPIEPDQVPEGRRVVEVQYVARGAVKRNESGPGKHIVIKGENILPCQVVGHEEEDRDPCAYNDPSFWRFPDALPQTVVAFAQISQSLAAACVDPLKTACFDTLTLFGPKASLASFPFDFLVLATPYRWYHLVALREGIIADYFCHVYPSTVEALPWTDKLAPLEGKIVELRAKYLDMCKAHFERFAVTIAALRDTDSETLQERIESLETLIFRIDGPRDDDAGFFTIQNGPEVFDLVAVNDKRTAEQLKAVMVLFKQERLSQEEMLQVPLPKSDGAAHAEILAEYNTVATFDGIQEDLAALDALVGPALGLTGEDVATMRTDLATDELFKRLDLRYAYQPKTRRGLLASLASSSRYAS
jgi:hypothetical protein